MPLKGLPIAPLTGLLDVRSLPDLLPTGSLRWRLNFQTTGDGKLRRGCGWTKLLDATTYNNQDFHDQLLTFSDRPGFAQTREPVTMLYESQSGAGIRTLWAATQSRIARLNETTGNWKIIGSGLGGDVGTDCTGPRFKAAVSGDYLFFTNNFDRPKVHRLEQPPFDDELLSDIPELETIGLTQANVVWVWKDVVFFADVLMDNQRLTYRIVWGDYQKPMSFDPAKPETIAGYKDLNFGERILAGLPTTANTFLIYTTHGIWELSAVGGDQVFAWREAYPGKKNDFTGILKYENTLVDIGGEHLYLSDDRPYLFSPYRSAPEPVEWVHRAAGVLYDDLDTAACTAHIGFVHGDEAFFSVKRNADSGCPGITLRINTQYKACDIVDHGFTAATNFRSQPIPTIRDFILDQQICTAAGIEAQMQALFSRGAFEDEGLPAPFATPSAAFAPETFYTPITQEIEPGLDTEDWEQETADAASLCALLGNTRLADLCQKCEGSSLLVLASATDWCLKEYGGFYRERCVNPTAVGTTGALGYTSAIGNYLLDAYDSLIRFAPMFQEGAMVTVERFKLNGIPVAQAQPAVLTLRVGISGQTADPNEDNCPIVWQTHSSRLLKCVTNRTAAQHLAAKSAPAQPIEWAFHWTGRNIFIELKIAGTGGDCILSGVVADAKSEPTHNF